MMISAVNMVNSAAEIAYLIGKARILLLVDLWEFFSDLGSRVMKKIKGSENDQLTGHFQSFFFNISRKNSKTSKVNQQSVLNL